MAVQVLHHKQIHQLELVMVTFGGIVMKDHYFFTIMMVTHLNGLIYQLDLWVPKGIRVHKDLKGTRV